ncbi:hypothetical protein PoB_005204300 [Plakobranchus ocellatus]|uniref:Uncharacterized protein n=1 Tax=Plakobranchus ocellatus TaxID=259542 RepID=A0AAV4C0X0_9GAST|nr:hypothetical protein PoB_005204300 [Plakobranchus ocellatus]
MVYDNSWTWSQARFFVCSCLLSSNTFLERMLDALEGHNGTISIGGRTITTLRFADATDGLAGKEEELASLGLSGQDSDCIWHGNQSRKDQTDCQQLKRHQH